MSLAPLLVSVASKTSPTDCGTPGNTYQVVNYSQNDTVWISNSLSVNTNVGMPIPPQAAVTVSYAHLYAILDSAAAAAVTLIIGSSIQDWAPSPVKNVTVSGPVTISGTVTVAGTVAISGGSVNIGTISGTVTITGPVSVVNNPGVFPLTSLTLVENNFNLGSSGSPQNWFFNLNSLSAYNALIIQTKYVPNPFTFTSLNSFEVVGYNGGVGGLILFDYIYWQQGTYGDDHAGLAAGGDNTLTIVPLNGIDAVEVLGQLPANATLNINAWGTNAQLVNSHRTQTQLVVGSKKTTPYLYNPQGRIPVNTGTTVHIPIPITSNGITIFMYSSGTGTGVTSTTVTITDSVFNTIRSYINLAIPKSTELPPITYPNGLAPQYISINEGGAAGTISQWEVLILENQLPQAA